MLKTSASLLCLGLVLSLTSVACSKQLGKPSADQSIVFKTEGEVGKKSNTEDQLKVANAGLMQLELLSLKLVKNNIHLEMAVDEPIEALAVDLSNEQKQAEIEKDLKTYIQITESLERLIAENPEIGDQGREYNLRRMKRAKETLALVALAKKSSAPVDQKQAVEASKDAESKNANVDGKSQIYAEQVLKISKLEEEINAQITNYMLMGINLLEVTQVSFDSIRALSEKDIQNLDLNIRIILGNIEEINSLRVAADLKEDLSKEVQEFEQKRLESLSVYQKHAAKLVLVIED